MSLLRYAHSLNALDSLASVRPNVKEIVREGGAQGVVSAMTEHGKNMDVINLSIRVLANLVSNVLWFKHVRLIHADTYLFV